MKQIFNFLVLPITIPLFAFVLLEGKLRGYSADQTLNDMVYEY